MQFDRHDLAHWDDPHPVTARARRVRLFVAAAITGVLAIGVIVVVGIASLP